MDNELFFKLESIFSRYKFLEESLSKVEIINNNDLFLTYYNEYSSYKNLIKLFIDYKKNIQIISSLEKLVYEEDIELKNLAKEELETVFLKQKEIESNLYKIFNPSEDVICDNIFLEIRSAAGGDEASLFSEDLFKMYSSFFMHNKWICEVMTFNYGNNGGYKEIIAKVCGNNVYSFMKNESGIHRVQRVPKTEVHGRIHTSTCSVAILPEVNIVKDINLDLNDLRIDTYRAGGAGGQHVNVTDSAVRIIHKPTGIVAECQDERSQHKNKQKALSLLKARLLFFEQNKQKLEIDTKRKNLIGSGIRSEKIRTYNYITNRITDHKNNFTMYKLDEVMSGKLWLLLDFSNK